MYNTFENTFYTSSGYFEFSLHKYKEKEEEVIIKKSTCSDIIERFVRKKNLIVLHNLNMYILSQNVK